MRAKPLGLLLLLASCSGNKPVWDRQFSTSEYNVSIEHFCKRNYRTGKPVEYDAITLQRRLDSADIAASRSADARGERGGQLPFRIMARDYNSDGNYEQVFVQHNVRAFLNKYGTTCSHDWPALNVIKYPPCTADELKVATERLNEALCTR